MATKRRPKSMYDTIPDDHDLFLDTLTKDEKEAMLSKKMEEIRRKNEALQRRHAEIEADKKQAEAKGYAVSLKSPPKDEGNNTDKAEKPPMRGVKVTVEEDALKGSGVVSRFSAGRGKRLAKMKGDAIKSQKQEQSRTVGDRRQSENANLHETPPPEIGRSYLLDDKRQGTLPDNHKNQSSRNRHSYGGTDFSNVKTQMQQERQKRRFDGPPQSKQEMEMRMTGRERREYSSWKQEREQIDEERLTRQRNTEGAWRREWDLDKRGTAPPTPPPSRHLEPGRRPGNKDFGGDHNKEYHQKPPPPPPQNQRHFRTSTEDDASHANHRQSRGFEDHNNDSPRQVVAQGKEDDSLVIQVLNDFSGEGLDGRRGAGRGGRGRGDRMERGGGSRGRGRGGDYSRGGDYHRGSIRGGGRGEGNRGRGDYGGGRGSSYGRGDYNTRGGGDYHNRGGVGEYRGRSGGRGGSRGRNYREMDRNNEEYGYSRGRGGGGGGGRGGSRGGRGARHRYQAEDQEEEPQILGTVVIDTTQSQTVLPQSSPSSHKSPPSKAGSLEPSGPLSPHSDKSWETTEGEWTSDSQGDAWEDEEVEETIGGEIKSREKDGNDDIDDDGEFGEDEDQYEEDDYWEEGIELQGTNIIDEFDQTLQITGQLQEELFDSKGKKGKKAEGADDGQNNDDDDDDDDAHNSSSESLDRFIQEHTLHLNIKTGNLVTAAESFADPTHKQDPIQPSQDVVVSPDKSSSSEQVLSPLTPMKTPEGHVHVINWAAEMSIEESPKKVEDLSMNTTLTSNSDVNDSPDKNTEIDQTTEVVEEKQVADIVKNLDEDLKESETTADDQTDGSDNRACGSDINEVPKDTLGQQNQNPNDDIKTIEASEDKDETVTSDVNVTGEEKMVVVNGYSEAMEGTGDVGEPTPQESQEESQKVPQETESCLPPQEGKEHNSDQVRQETDSCLSSQEDKEQNSAPTELS